MPAPPSWSASSEELAKHMKTENVKWKKVIDAAKLEPQ